MRPSIRKFLGIGTLISVFIVFTQPLLGQRKIRKLLQDSTREQVKLYKKQAQFSVDSFNRAQKYLDDSIRKKNNSDTIPFKKNFRVGLDLSKLTSSWLDKTRQNFEVSLDYHAKTRLYYAGELGLERVSYNVPNYYRYSSNGAYVKLGFDYGIFKITRRNDHNIVYTGARLGLGLVSFKADSIRITDPYFGNQTASNINGNAKGFWLEFVFGTKVEVFHRIFLGWSVRLSSRLNNLTTQENYPVRVPGFGDSAASQTFNYTYSVFYSF